ncbi:hypothetical protein F5Y18DRAFT_325188 [Xylariaceae sp. FL1019]|nr:hypothetical protein F5Y18DRAFT_325188 [Xylariaceae sp. FL1019]
MLSLSSLLNPAPPGRPAANRFPPSPASSSPTDSCVEDYTLQDRHSMPKHKMPKDAAVFTKSKPKGSINFQPFERLDETSLRSVRKFQVYPLGKIQEYSRHIPYNSGKKDFYEKTGRESFEVFQYVFKTPSNDTEYAVMWDYNVGLVRMTPFFKCCKYPKTTPAKMLNSNPGLKEITHSITGGSIMAQGYWMPYQCAKAVCATFCWKIAGALIPIFGPDFPSLCIAPEAPDYGRMIIEAAIVIQSTREAEHFRRLYSNNANPQTGQKTADGDASPRRDRRMFRAGYDDASRNHPRYRIRKPYLPTPGHENIVYTTDTDGEISPNVERGSVSRAQHHHLQRPMYSSIPLMGTPGRPNHDNISSHGWTPANLPHGHPQTQSQSQTHAQSHPHAQYQTPGPSPWLSAIPRFTTAAHLAGTSNPHTNTHPHARQPAFPTSHQPTNSHPHSHPHSQSYSHGPTQSQLPSPSDGPPRPYPPMLPSPRTKRPAAQIEDEPEHRYAMVRNQGQRPNQMPPMNDRFSPRYPISDPPQRHRDRDSQASVSGPVGADKKAALLLMNLSVHDTLWKTAGKVEPAEEAARDNNRAFNSNRRDARYEGEYEEKERGKGKGKNVVRMAIGVSSADNTPLEGHFPNCPRVKRVRSNSM